MHMNILRQTETAMPGQLARRQRGFTLIEMLVVLGIIAFIATLVGVGVLDARRKAQRRQAIVGVQLVASAVERYELDCGVLPSRIEDLRRAPDGLDNWSGPYLKATNTKDPWGTPYVLAIPGSDGQLYSVRSLGADRVAGGAGDAADIDSSD
ncbi:MAG: type II secretion system protein GspG [Lysobacterales bacterium]